MSRTSLTLPLSKVIAEAFAILASGSSTSSNLQPSSSSLLSRDTPFICFEGQVVRVDHDTDTDTSADSTLQLQHQPSSFAIHSDAMRLFYKLQKSVNVEDPVILWLKAEVDTITFNKPRSVSKKRRDKQTPAIIMIDSDNDDDDNGNKYEGKDKETSDAESAVSWSDSDREMMDLDSGEDEDRAEPEKKHCPLVAVLLCRKSMSDSLPGQIFEIQPGDWIQVNDAALLVEANHSGDENGKPALIACVGKPKSSCRLFIGVKADTTPPSKAGTAVRTCPGSPTRARTKPHLSNTINRPQGANTSTLSRDATKTLPSDRTYTHPPPVRTVTPPIVRTIAPPASKIATLTSMETSRRLSLPFQAPQTQILGLNPLELLVSSLDNPRPQRVEPEREVVSLSQVWTLMPETAESETQGRSSEADIHRHVCSFSSINTCRIRAICAECENDYRNMACTFGCTSKKWRLDIQMDCSIQDGTAEATLRIEKSQEVILWTLLGLLDDSRLGGDASGGGTVGRRSKESMEVLKILSRRGVLSFKKVEATASSISEGLVEIVNEDTSQRAKEEEKLWLEICLGKLARQSSTRLERFVLDSTVVPPSLSSSSSSSGTSSSTATAPFVKRSVFVGRQRFMTLVARQSLVLNAVDVKWISPFKEAKMLLSLFTNRE